VGDLVNRGPKSVQVLRRIRELGAAAIAVLGNHDLHLLAVAAGHARLHDGDTAVEVLMAPDRDELLDWLRRLPLAFLEGSHLMIHGGVLPQWTAARTHELAQEVEAALQGSECDEFLRHLHGNEPNRWSDDLRGWDRLRVIVNVLTRIRFCAADGHLEFKEKRGHDRAPEGYAPWFAHENRLTRDVTVVCGHWSALGLMLRPNVAMLDSGCVWGGPLTAMRLEDRRLFQVPSRQAIANF
jgi:bis(5'-nucleosyl)-tetraphosphatase (symmetrical)